MKHKALLKSLMAFLALTACLALTPKTSLAQHSVPYSAWLEFSLPEDWTANNFHPVDGYFSSGVALLPELDASINTLCMDIEIRPRSQNSATSFEIGYYTYYTFFSCQTFSVESGWINYRNKRLAFSDVPSGARLALRFNGEWEVNTVDVYTQPDPVGLPYSIDLSHALMEQSDGWIANSWCNSGRFVSGTALLPQFSVNISSLLLDIGIKPASDSDAQSIELGYISNPSSYPSSWNFTPLQTYNYFSSWTYCMPKRVSFEGAPSGARMAVRFNGTWFLEKITVDYPPSPVNVPYHALLGGYSQPSGWWANNYGYDYYNGAFLMSGTTLLPEFNVNSLYSLLLDLSIKPRNSDAQSIEIGYVTNNNPSSFTPTQTYTNSSLWTDYRPKRIPLSGQKRLAIRCTGDWYIRNLSVYYPPTSFDVPYTPTLGDPQPQGWTGNNYYISGDETYLANGYTILPSLNATSAIQLDVSLKPLNSNTQSIQIGYVTNPNNPSSSFTALQTFYNESSWSNYEPKRIPINSLPNGAKLAFNCSASWCIANLSVVYPPSAFNVPYNQSLGSLQPSGWMANNYSSGHYFKTGTALLPVFNPAINMLQLDLSLKPNNSSAQNIQVGYVTNNNPSNFTALQTYSYSSSWNGYQPKSVTFTNVPAGARMAIKCIGEWNITTVHVDYVSGVTTYSVPYAPTLGSLMPEGWTTNNYYFDGNWDVYLTSGYTQLPRFNVALNTLQLDIMLKPKGASSQSIQFGYFNSNSTFVPVETFSTSSSWTGWRSKRIVYNVSGVPNNARMVIYCNGDWWIDYVSVTTIPQPAAIPYYINYFTETQPEGWIMNNYIERSLAFGTKVGPGVALLPQFEIGVNNLILSMRILSSSGYYEAPTFSIGYVTNNNPYTFVALATYGYTTAIVPTVSYADVPSNVRMAISCTGIWYMDEVRVDPMPPIEIPLTQNFESIANNSLPTGWQVLQNYSIYVNNASNLAHSGSKCIDAVQGNGYLALPRTASSLSNLTLDFYLKPYHASQNSYDAHTANDYVSVGYLTNPPDVSTYHEVQRFGFDPSENTPYRQKKVVFPTLPANAYITFKFYSEVFADWYIDDLHIDYQSSLTLPYSESFENYEKNSLPDGWMPMTNDRVYVDNLYSYSYSGSKYLNMAEGDGYVALPKLATSYQNVMLDFRLMPDGIESGFYMHTANDYVSVGYLTTPTNMSTYHEVTRFNYTSVMGGVYQKKHVNFDNLPANAYITFKFYSTYLVPWYIDDVSVYSVEAVPYTQEFESNSIPEGWKSYCGALEGMNNPHTATLTPESGRWHFGAANGVFDGSSHAWVNIGHYLHHFWLISPLVQLDANANMLSFDLALTRPTGNMVPITPDDQTYTRIFVLVSADNGATWTKLQAWKERDTAYSDLDDLMPEGATMTYNMADYAGQNVLIGFYMECTDADDASNRIHIDNFSIESFDPTLPPTSVTVSQVGSHSAKVSWTPTSPAQNEWDVAVAPQWITTSNQMEGYENTIMKHVSGCLYTTMTGLASANSYHAWVRYNNGTTTSAWTRTIDYFTTAEVCGHPTITNVEASPTTLFVTWEPGESDQTSFTVYVSGSDYPSEFDFENVTSALIDVSNFIEPEENYTVQVGTICSDNGDEIFSDYWTGTMAPWPTLTMNDGTNTSYTAVINAYETSEGYASTQFVVPASQLEDMQHSYIEKLQFYCSNVQNGQPWGSNASFEVRMAVVDFDDYSGICGDDFFPWSSMSLFYDGSLSITNGVMTLIPNYSYSGNHFRYEGGSLLIGIKQTEDGTSSQASWYGVNTPAAMSGHIVYQDNPDIVVCDYFAPKVTFGYAQDAYLPPTDIVVEPIGNYEVYVSWTMRDGSTAVDFEISDDNFTDDIWGYEDIEGGYLIYDDVWPDDDFQVRLRSVFVVDGETIRSVWSQPVSFTMPEICESPYNLEADNIGPFSATLAWEGDAVEYEVEYREVLSEGFENGVPEGWTAVKKDDASGGWFKAGLANTGSFGLASICTTSHGDDWLISPQVELGGTLSFYRTCAGQNTVFSIYVSTTGTDIDGGDFELVATGTAYSTWYKFTKSLSNYSGLGYIAIRHNDIAGGTKALYIDDLLYSYPSWTTLDATTENSIEVSGLTPGKSYQFQVRGTCETTGFTSDWSSAFVFTTESNIVFEDPIVKAACVYAWDANGNGDGELSYAEAAAVTDITNVFNGDSTITSFNELQYFTGLTEIGDHAFAGCTNLAQITLPPQITYIDDYAFGSCSSLQSITIPNGVATIGNYAFSESGLTYVGLPNTLTQIGMLAFGNCNNLTAVYLPATVTNIDGNAFTGASIESIAVAVDNPNYDSRGGCNAIIETATNKLITGCQNTIIPDDVTTIGISAFENATGLTEITLPASLTSIGQYAFLNCYGLTTINAESETPPDIYGNTFMNLNQEDITVIVPCGTLLDYRNANYWEYFNFVDPCNIVFADANVKAVCVANWDTSGDGELSYAEAAAVTNLGTLFQNNTTITSFDELQYFTGLPALAAHAFDGCSQLTSVILPNSIIINIGNYAFSGCSSLVSVTLSNQLRRILNNAFLNCSALTQIDIPSSVTSIGASFAGCSSLSSIVIPASATSIAYNAFDDCYSLQSIVVNSGNTVYDSRNDCNAIIKTETNELVIGCDNTVIPDDVVTIGQNAFYGRHQMTTITLPASVTSIGNQAFYSCRGLTEMHIEASTPPTVGTNVFNGNPTGVSNAIPVYVPCEAIETYQSTSTWDHFINYQNSDVFICFADPNVKALCVANWDTNEDGELSYGEAVAVMSIGTVFSQNTSITSFDELQYFTSLEDIPQSAFRSCTALVSVTLPESVGTIGNYAFQGCSNLQSVNLPNSLTQIHVNAFKNCANLTGELTITASISLLDESAFENCSGLTDLVFEGAPNLLESNFSGCSGLTSITCQSMTPPTVGFDVFFGVDTSIPVYVPCDAVADYQAATGWSEFTNIIDPCAGAVQTVELTSGWNYVSTYIDMNQVDGMAMLKEALGDYGVTIVTFDDQAEYLGDGFWLGLEDYQLTNGEMILVEVSEDCTLTLEGPVVDPSTIEITINPEWNYIGYPLAVEMTVEEAMSAFEAEFGDGIANFEGLTEYLGEWMGDFETLVPGQGYMYYSYSDVPKTLVFSTGSKARAKGAFSKAKPQLVKPDNKIKE